MPEGTFKQAYCPSSASLQSCWHVWGQTGWFHAQCCFSSCIALMRILLWGKRRKTLTDSCKHWEALPPDNYSDHKRFIGCIVLYVVPWEAIYLPVSYAGRARWVSTAAILSGTAVHAKPPHLFCTAQNLLFLESFLWVIPRQASLAFQTRYYKMHTTNGKGETAGRQCCSFAGNRKVLLIRKLWMLNQIIQWLLSVSAKKLQLLRAPRKLRAMEALAALECYVIALAASMLWSGAEGRLAPDKSFSVAC